MRWLINRYSYLIFSFLALAGAGLAASRLGRLAGTALVLGVGGMLAGVQAALRSGSSLSSWREVEAALGRGRPALLFIYSDT